MNENVNPYSGTPFDLKGRVALVSGGAGLLGKEFCKALISAGAEVILTDNNESREKLRKHLEVDGIETRPVFYPIHTMPMFSEKYQQHKVAESIGWRGINLPSYPDLEKHDLEFICNSIRKFFN